MLFIFTIILNFLLLIYEKKKVMLELSYLSEHELALHYSSGKTYVFFFLASTFQVEL